MSWSSCVHRAPVMDGQRHGCTTRGGMKRGTVGYKPQQRLSHAPNGSSEGTEQVQHHPRWSHQQNPSTGAPQDWDLRGKG